MFVLLITKANIDRGKKSNFLFFIVFAFDLKTKRNTIALLSIGQGQQWLRTNVNKLVFVGKAVYVCVSARVYFNSKSITFFLPYTIRFR
jgi:hypothetical protein